MPQSVSESRRPTLLETNWPAHGPHRSGEARLQVQASSAPGRVAPMIPKAIAVTGLRPRSVSVRSWIHRRQCVEVAGTRTASYRPAIRGTSRNHDRECPSHIRAQSQVPRERRTELGCLCVGGVPPSGGRPADGRVPVAVESRHAARALRQRGRQTQRPREGKTFVGGSEHLARRSTRDPRRRLDPCRRSHCPTKHDKGHDVLSHHGTRRLGR